MVNKIKISAVSYLNTKPFVYGLQHSDIINEIDLSLDIPSMCAKKLLNDEVDIGLVPVSILPELKEHYILTDYCIGAEGAVKSVILFSEVPLNEIKNIYLDYQSKTSVQLVKVLAQNFWKIKPAWIDADKNYEEEISDYAAGIVIGDRALELKNKFKFSYDLAEEWKKFTGLPFIFACWVSNKKLPEAFINKFNQAICFGIENKESVITNPNEREYFEKYISYEFDEKKKKAMKLFLELSDLIK